MEASERIIVALDVSDIGEAVRLVEQLAPLGVNFKFGLELITHITVTLLQSKEVGVVGDMVHELRRAPAERLFTIARNRIMWDTKLSDIPNTMAGAVKALGALSPNFFTIHASSGKASIEAAVEHKGSSKVLGVTVLTSIDGYECQSIFNTAPNLKVLEFARDLAVSGADGIVCSPQELTILAPHGHPNALLKVIPGIRPDWAVTGDQSRIMTPAKAIQAGADYLVIGRPITKPPEHIGTPVDAVYRIVREIESVLT